MQGLEKLLAKIDKDAQTKAGEIIAAAEKEAEALLAESRDAAGREADKVIKAAEEEAKRLGGQISSQAQLDRRNSELEVKQEIIDGVFELTLKKLNALPDDELLTYITKSLEGEEALSGQMILLPEKCKLKLAAINKALKAAGSAGDFAAYKGSKTISGGFMLFKDGIERNFTFDALLSYKRNELVADIIEMVF